MLDLSEISLGFEVPTVVAAHTTRSEFTDVLRQEARTRSAEKIRDLILNPSTSSTANRVSRIRLSVVSKYVVFKA